MDINPDVITIERQRLAIHRNPFERKRRGEGIERTSEGRPCALVVHFRPEQARRHITADGVIRQCQISRECQ